MSKSIDFLFAFGGLTSLALLSLIREDKFIEALKLCYFRCNHSVFVEFAKSACETPLHWKECFSFLSSLPLPQNKSNENLKQLISVLLSHCIQIFPLSALPIILSSSSPSSSSSSLTSSSSHSSNYSSSSSSSSSSSTSPSPLAEIFISPSFQKVIQDRILSESALLIRSLL
eukprot:MONOS_14612.1-p1 / transcript=MONOS_14612.1 / gene=MONOS_14612 / organism=Monocercomonoides_exilis_PA203 / gene_product=unspecified product / transcript_product=unspecified product / location=Mono_scaffold01035:8363-9117(+) / protein_length=172 / sequence_SO=supercontig / SO=protein_coding / is_pseudo=false